MAGTHYKSCEWHVCHREASPLINKKTFTKMSERKEKFLKEKIYLKLKTFKYPSNAAKFNLRVFTSYLF